LGNLEDEPSVKKVKQEGPTSYLNDLFDEEVKVKPKPKKKNTNKEMIEKEDQTMKELFDPKRESSIAEKSQVKSENPNLVKSEVV
jgi:hypothetical protein